MMKRYESNTILLTAAEYAELGTRRQAGATYHIVDQNGEPTGESYAGHSGQLLSSEYIAQATGVAVQYATRAVLQAINEGVRASYFGIRTNSTSAQTSKFQEAMSWCRTNGKALLLPAGTYIYDDWIPRCGGGLVAVGGRAKLVCAVPEPSSGYLKTSLWDFANPGPDIEWQDGLVISGVDFYDALRPDNCLGLGAAGGEPGTFVRVTKVRNVVVADTTFSHNYGGAIILKNVRGAYMVNLRAEDVIKDNFHATWGSEDVAWVNCVSIGSGDDAFATVGYSEPGGAYDYLGAILAPRRIAHINCRAEGARAGRGFAYVGCSDFLNVNCSYDGRVPDYIPQLVANPNIADTSGDAVAYHGFCGLYIACEDSFKTHGTKRGRVRNLVVQNTAQPFRPSSGARTTTLHAIHIAAQRSGDDRWAIEDIEIDAQVRDTQNSFFTAYSLPGMTRGLKLNINGYNCTDPEGWGKDAVAGAGTAGGIEIQGVRDITLRGQVVETGRAAVYINETCEGFLDMDLTLGRNNKTATAGVDSVMIAPNSKLQDITATLRYAEPPPYAGAGGSTPYAVENIIEAASNQGKVRSLDLVGNVGAAGVAISAPTTVLATTPASGWTWQNNTGRRALLRINAGGTWDAVGLSAVRRAVSEQHHVQAVGRDTVVAVPSSTSVALAGSVASRYPAGTAVSFYSATGDVVGTATTHASTAPVEANGVTTVTLAAALPAQAIPGTLCYPNTAAGTITLTGDAASRYPSGTTVHLYNTAGNLIATGTTSGAPSGSGPTVVTLTALPTAARPGLICSAVPTTWGTIETTTAANVYTDTSTSLRLSGNRVSQYPTGTVVHIYKPGGDLIGTATVTGTPTNTLWYTTVPVSAVPAGVTSGCVATPGATPSRDNLLAARRGYVTVMPGEFVRLEYSNPPASIYRLPS